MPKCAGPCLEHCYKRTNNNNYIYLFMGIFIGILIYYMYNNYNA
jgi:hypothetical protein